MKLLPIIILFIISASTCICQANETSTGPAPFPAHSVTPAAHEQPLSALSSLGVPGYAIDHTSKKFTFFNVTQSNSFESKVFPDRFISGADFLKDNYDTLYGVSYFSNEFVKIDTHSGILSVVGPCFPDDSWEVWTGMAGHPNGTLYACSTDNNISKLYIINPENGIPYSMGVVSNAPLLIAIAINAQGDIYGLDILNDNLILIDKNPAKSTIIGPIGYDANHSQGMDFDDKTGILYISAFNDSTFRAEIRVANLETGNTTLLYPVDNSLFKLDSLAIATWAGGLCVPQAQCFAPYNGLKTLATFLNTDPGMVLFHGTNVDFTAGADFLDGDYSKLYGVTYSGNEFVTISTDGIQTVIGPCAPTGTWQSWTGMAADPDGTLYACSTSVSESRLFTIDPATGVPTLIGPVENSPALIDIAISPRGQMYGMDLVNDNIVLIDKSTGFSSVLGFLDFSINFSQGMDFDDEHGILYLGALNATEFRTELFIADTNTAHTTSLGVIGDGLTQCDDIAIVSGAGDALKIYSLKTTDKGPGKSSIKCVAGYNWPGQMPVSAVSFSLGTYSAKNIPVMHKGSKFQFSTPEVKGLIDPTHHRVLFSARKIDPVGSATPDLKITLRGFPIIYGQHRNVVLENSTYSEPADISTPLFYVDNASIADSSSTGKDKCILSATLNGTTTGADTVFSITITGENGVILSQVIPASEFTNKKDVLSYKRPKGAVTPIKKATVSLKDKTVSVMAANYDMTANALGTTMDPLVTINVSADFAAWKGSGEVRVRFNQKTAGKATF